MTVLLEENHACPVISFNALVKVGSASETDKESGICHVIEHMMFKGTPTYPVGEIARSVEAAGGDINAYTSFDQTVYYINMASMFADKGLSILADALKNPLFDAQELDREKEVILEEIRREKDHPMRIISEDLFKHAYSRHPYGRPIIGFPKTVKSFTRKTLINFHRHWYTPENMVFIAVGDFKTSKMIKKLNGLFADLKVSRSSTSIIPTKSEPKQKSLNLIVKTANIQNTHLAMAWHIPSMIHDHVPTLDVASHILGGSESSRLEQVVKEKRRLVHHVNSYAYTPKDPGILTVIAIMGDKDVPKALEAIMREVNRLHHEPVQIEELSRAKINIRSNEIYEKETVGGQAGKVAYFEATAGSHEFEKRYYQLLQDVSTEGVMEVAQQYLTPNNLTAVLLLPNKSKWAKQKDELARIIKPKKQPAPRAKKTAPKELTTLQRMRLKNGMTLVVKQNHHNPLVSMCATSPGGIRYETNATNGISNLMARVMTKGTKTRTAVRIAKDIEKIAGHLDGFSGRNSVGLKCEFLSEHLRDGFELFSDVLAHPAWDAREVENERQFVLHSIRDQEDALGTMAFVHFLKALFPNHPYGMRTIGHSSIIKKLSSKQIQQFYSNAFKPSQMVLSVVGDVNPDEIACLVEECFADLPKGRLISPKIKKEPRPRSPKKVIHHKEEKQQAHIVMGFQGTTIKDKDRYAFTVLNNILAGQGGRLFLELRDKMGLAYVVSSLHQEGVEPGFFAVYMGTEPTKVDIAIDGIKNELNKVTTKMVDKDELERAQQYIVGTYELESQRNSALASAYAFNELYGLGIDEVAKYPKKVLSVTRRDVLEVAKRYITLDAPVLSIIRPS
jgi:zinc protease